MSFKKNNLFLFFFFKGSPASSVSWWQDGQLIDGSFEEIIPGKSRNTMKVESLHRQHRHTEFTCSGNNNNRSQALSKSVILDLYCKYTKYIVMGSSSIIRVPNKSGFLATITILKLQPFDTKCVAGDRELISNNVFRYNQNHAINLMH